MTTPLDPASEDEDGHTRLIGAHAATTSDEYESTLWAASESENLITGKRAHGSLFGEHTGRTSTNPKLRKKASRPKTAAGNSITSTGAVSPEINRSIESSNESQYELSRDAVLSQHRAAVQKIFEETTEQIEIIMQKLATALLASGTEGTTKTSSTSGDAPKSPRPHVYGTAQKAKKDNLEAKRDNVLKARSLDRIEENPREKKQEERDKGVSEADESDVKIEKVKAHGIFADADAMKAQLREAMSRPAYDVQNFYWDTGVFQAIARSSMFENLTLSVIAFNALWIAVDVDANPADVINDAPAVFIVMDNFFCIYFCAEIVIRFGAFKNKRDCLLDRWFMFDSCMCILMIFETWVLCIMFAVGSSSSGGGLLGDASLLKGFRLIRLVRMARMLRLLNSMPELMVLIKGMKVAFRAVSCTVCLLLIIIYVFAVALRQITDETATGNRDFPTVLDSARFLLIQGTMPDLFTDATRIWEENWFFALVFLFFILVVSITVMNMLVGVLVGVVNTVSQVEKEQLMVQFVKSNLVALMKGLKIDEDGDGHIDRHEFDQLLQQPAAIRSFDQMGVDVVGLVDLADFIFKDGHALPFGEFMEVIMQLRGSNQATVKDIVDLRKCVVLEMHQMRIEMHALNEHALILSGHDEDAVAISIPKSKQFAMMEKAGGLTNRPMETEVDYCNHDNDVGRSPSDMEAKEERKKKGPKAVKPKHVRTSHVTDGSAD